MRAGRALVVPRDLRPAVDVLRPVTRVAYWSSHNTPGDLSRDGRTLAIPGEGIYDPRSGRRAEWPADDRGVRFELANERTQIDWEPYAHLRVLDGSSGRVITRISQGYSHTFVLADGQTIIGRDPDGRTRARRLEPERRAEPSVWWSWRLCAVAAAVVAVRLGCAVRAV